MANSTYTSLKIELIPTGNQSGTWGDTTNSNLESINEAITGSANVAFSSADVTLTLTDSVASQTARNLRLNLTGTSGGARNLIVPAIEKQYIVYNGLADAVTVKNSTGSGVAVPAGKSTIVFNDATNVVEVVTSANVTTGTAILKGNGTGGFANAVSGTDYAPATSGTAILKANGSGAFANAVSGTDYAPATSGVGILRGDNAGGFANVTVGSGLNYASNTLTANVAVYPSSGIAVSTGTAWGTSLTAPTGTVVGTSDSQTLTNKTISVDNNTVSGIAASSFVLSDGSGNIDGTAAQKAIPTGTVVGTSDTQTLTNKRVTPRVVTSGSTSGTLTPTGDTADLYIMTGLTGTATIDIPSGTPTNGQRLTLRIKDDGTSRNLSWTTSAGGYRIVGTLLPTSTTANKTIYVGCIYNALDVYWDVVAVASEV